MSRDEPVDARKRWRIFAQGAAGAIVLLTSVAVVQYAAHRARLSSATRLVLTDVARFDGCLFAGDVPAPADRAARVTALARGRGDHLWPHSCAIPMSRLQDTTSTIAEDHALGPELHHETTAMDGALGEAVFWTTHEQAGEDREPEWLRVYSAWHDVVERFVHARGETLHAVEIPRDARRPLLPSEVVVPPTVLPIGDDVEFVDAVENDHGAWVLFRDKHAALALCHFGTGASGACGAFTLGANERAEDIGFAKGDGPAMLVVRRVAPDMTCDLVDVADGARTARGVATDRRRVVSLAAGTFVATGGNVVGPSVHRVAPLDVPINDQCLAPLHAGASPQAVRSGFVQVRVSRGAVPGIAEATVFDDTGVRIASTVHAARVAGEVPATRAANPAESRAEVSLGTWSWRIGQDGAIETRRREPAPTALDALAPMNARHRDGSALAPQNGVLTLVAGPRTLHVTLAHVTTAEVSDDGGRTFHPLAATR